MKSVAAANTASMFQDLALIGALAERHFVDSATRLCRAAREHHKTVGEGGVTNLFLQRILPCHLNYFDQQLQNANKWFASTKGIIAKSVRMFSVGRAATHTSWFINLAVEVLPACRPAASGGGWTFGKCKMSGFEMGHGIRDKAINSRNPASIGSR